MFSSSSKKEPAIATTETSRSSSAAINKLNKSSEYLHLREQLDVATKQQLNIDQENNPLDLMMGYLGADVINVLRTEAKNCLQYAEQHAQSHVGYDYCLRAVFYYQAASVLAQQYELKNELAVILQALSTANQRFPILAFESALVSSATSDVKSVPVNKIVADNKALDLQRLQKDSHKEKLIAIRQLARDQLERYQTQSWSASAKAVLPVVSVLTASLGNKSICFEEHAVKGDGNCGFTALATNRVEVVALLLACAAQVETRKFLAPEIKALLQENRQLALHTKQTQKLFTEWDALDSKCDDLVRKVNDELEKVSVDVKSPSTFHRQGLEGLIKLLITSSEPHKQKVLGDLQQLQSQLSRIHAQLDADCGSIEMFQRYVQQSLGGTEWLGYRSALLFARLKNYSVYIFHQPSAKSSELALLEKHESANAINTFYLLHTGRYTHYNILTEANTPVAKDTKEAPKEKPLTMQSIYQTVSLKLKELLSSIIAESIADYHALTKNYPPCDYTFIALGSLAREAITPYSDLEFGLLIEDKQDKAINEKNKTYFRNLCRLINFKLLALGETPANILNIKMPEIDDKVIPNPIPKGICFDACVDGGYKNPLGKRNAKGELIFELIGTPIELADYQQEHHYQKADEKNNQPAGKLVSEPLLPGSLTQARLLVSGQASDFLLSQYQQKVIDYLKQSATNLWGNSLPATFSFNRRQAKALDLLVADLARFRARFGKQEESSRSFSVKHDLYRLLDMIFDQLALYCDIPTHSLWDQLKTLSQATDKRPALFNVQAQANLLKAIDRTTEYRLDAYLTLGEQSENEELTQDYQIAFKGQQTTKNKLFHLPAKQVYELYNSLILLWQAAKWFCDSRGGESAFAHPVLQNFSSAAPWVEAQRTLLLQGPVQVLQQLSSVLRKNETHDNKATQQPTHQIEQALTLQIAGSAYMESGRALAEAQHCLERAQLLFEQVSIQEKNKFYNGEAINCHLGLAKIYWRQSRTTEAQQQLAKAKVLLETCFSLQHPYSAEYQTTAYLLQGAPGSLPRLSLLNKNWHVPPDNKQYFVGRAESLEKLQQHFKSVQAGTKQCFISTISGLGGIGKTQLAIKFIHDPRHDYSLRLWFRAEQEITLLQDYIDFGQLFQLLAEGERVQQDEIIRRVKQYLETHPNWLAVYDNALDYQAIKRFLPSHGGHVVITTRASKERLEKELYALKDEKNSEQLLVLSLAIEKFSKEEALYYLKTYTSRVGADEEKAMNELAEKVDYLPLALAQAAAYIKRCGLTTADYLERYKTSYQKLLESKLLPADSTDRDKDKIIKTVATTWEASLQAIREEEVKANSIASNQQPIAIMLLQVMSYLDADQIPQSLLTQWLRVTHFVDEKEINHQLKTALDRLEGYSLIQKDHKEQVETINIHRLVQTVIRDRGLVDAENVVLQNNKTKITNNDTKQDEKLLVDQSLALVKQPPAKPHPSVLPTSSAMMATILPMVLELLGNDIKDKTNHNWVRVCTLIAFTRAKQQIDLRTNLEIERAAEKYKQARRLFEQVDIKATEAPLREAIKIYSGYGNSYSGELCDSYLDLALLLHSQKNSTSRDEAKVCLTKANKILEKVFGAADARHSRCKDISWYLIQQGAFAVKQHLRFDVWHLPNNNEKYFTGRKSLLETLNKQHQSDQVYKTIVLSAVSGLGGVGKTQLAIYYLYHTQQRYNLRAWFRAENATVLLMDYRMFAQEFNLLPIEEQPSSKEIITVVKRYLETHTDWLAVYDNAGLRDEIREYLPTQGGQVIVTTRRQEWNDVGMKVEVSVFEPEEAIAYLKKLTGIQDHVQEISELAKALGYLPLALNQAGAYIKKQNITIQQYLQDYYQRAAKVLENRPQIPNEDSNTDTVASTWQISLQAIEEDEKRNNEPHLSLPVLQAMAYLHAEDIPRDILEKWLVGQKLVADLESTKLVLDKTIQHLLGYSLIHVNADRRTVSIHRLVQDVVEQELVSLSKNPVAFEIKRKKIVPEKNINHMGDFLRDLANSLDAEFCRETQILADESRQSFLLPHMQSLVKHYDKALLTSSVLFSQLALASLEFNIGNVLLKKGQASKTHYERALKIKESFYGPYHWQVAIALHNLAIAYGALGDAKTQKVLLEWALKIKESYYGPDHPQVAMTLGSLANAIGDLGEDKKKKDLLERALKIFEVNFGAEHWQVAATLDNLGSAYGALGDAKKQIEVTERALKINEGHYGSDHWQVAINLTNLASAYAVLGDAKKQKELTERALKIKEGHYGSDHWQLIVPLVSLANATGDLGDTKKKKDLLERSLKIGESHYGPDHWQITATLNALANATGDLGETVEKKNLLERAWKIIESHYGPDHWRVAGTLNNLANAYGALGDTKKKKDLLERSLKIGESHYGLNHSAIAPTLNDLANATGDLGNTKEQKELLGRALKIKESHYGPDHWQVALTLVNLGVAFRVLGDPKRAILLQERALKIFEKQDRPNPLHVAVTLDNLVDAFGDLEDAKKQKELLERYSSDHLKVALNRFKRAIIAYQHEHDFSYGLHLAERSYPILLKNNHPNNERQQLRLRMLLLETEFNRRLNALCEADILECLQKRDEKKAREYFKVQKLNFDDCDIQYELAKLYVKKLNVKGVICHLEMVLHLLLQQNGSKHLMAKTHNDLGCYYHCYSDQQHEFLTKKEFLSIANQHFQDGLKLAPYPGLYTDYGNFLLRQKRALEAIQHLENVLKPATLDAKTVAEEPASLSYSEMERCTLDATLQKELDCWREVTIKATTFAHYLLVTAYHQQNNNEAAQKAVVTFEKFVAQENDPLTFSLLGHAQFLIKSYASATVSYMQASELKPGYIIAEQQLKQCQALLGVSAAQPPSSQAVADTKNSNNSKLSLAALAVNSSAIFSSAATAAAPANIQTSNPAPVLDDAAELEKAIKLSLSEQVVNSASTAAVANPAADVADDDKEELQKAMQLSLEP